MEAFDGRGRVPDRGRCFISIRLSRIGDERGRQAPCEVAKMATARCRPSKSLARAAFRHGFLQLAGIAAEAQPRCVFDKRRHAIFKGLSSRVAWIDLVELVCAAALYCIYGLLSPSIVVVVVVVGSFFLFLSPRRVSSQDFPFFSLPDFK